MSIFYDDDAVVKTRANRRGRAQRKAFGIAMPGGILERSVMYIPHNAGAKVGQRIRYAKVPEGLAFRIGDDGEYGLYASNKVSKILRTGIPDILAQFARREVRDLVVQPYHDGWLIPFDQFGDLR